MWNKRTDKIHTSNSLQALIDEIVILRNRNMLKVSPQYMSTSSLIDLHVGDMSPILIVITKPWVCFNSIQFNILLSPGIVSTVTSLSKWSILFITQFWSLLHSSDYSEHLSKTMTNKTHLSAQRTCRKALFLLMYCLFSRITRITCLQNYRWLFKTSLHVVNPLQNIFRRCHKYISRIL